MDSMKPNVLVIGQGYVGFPLAFAAAQAGYQVFGYDKNPHVISSLKLGIDHTSTVIKSEITELIDKGKINFINELPLEKNFRIIVVCVPTPLTELGVPDLSYLDLALNEIARLISHGTLLVIESTIATGTTRNHILPIISKSTLMSESELNIAFAPERIDPGNKNWNLENTPKLLAALSENALSLAREFYGTFVKNIVICNSVEIAETAKLLENSFRLVNISFINEISNFCHKIGIDINEVISSAATKPYGFMTFYPSLGVGGHCIPVDPIYLLEESRNVGSPITMVELANKINDTQPQIFVNSIIKKYGNLTNKQILVLGVAYKPNVSDIRETPVKKLIQCLEANGAEVYWHDELVKEWNGSKSTSLSHEFDLAILATPHDYFDLSKLGDVPIFNTRGSIL